MKFSLHWLSITLLLASCAQMRQHVTQGSRPEAKALMDTAEVEWLEFAEMNEQAEDDTHVLVETQASDVEISVATGSHPEEEDETYSQKSEKPFLKERHTKRVKFWIDYFNNKQRERFQRFLNNGAMYRPIIEKIFEEEGLPRELFFVGLIESGYYLRAHSHASAVGPWQFIRATGKRYGLTINREIDERQDIFKATRAAAKYFKDLYQIFSSWELALAAYNAGEYGIIRRINKYRTRDYYRLSAAQKLHPETINYVPKVIAAMYLAHNAEKYGFHHPLHRAQLWQKTKTVKVPRGVTLSRLARQHKVSQSLLLKLNPELKSSRTPRVYSSTRYALRVPTRELSTWQESLRDINIKPHDRKGEIAKLKQKINPAESSSLADILAPYQETSLENVAKTKQVRVSKKTIARTQPIKFQKKLSARPLVYRVHKGDTLTDVARWFGTSVNALKKQNAITRGKQLEAGKSLTIPDSKKGTYTVKRGDYLLKIAGRFRLDKTAIMRLNNLKRAHLIPGQKLIVNLE